MFGPALTITYQPIDRPAREERAGPWAWSCYIRKRGCSTVYCSTTPSSRLKLVDPVVAPAAAAAYRLFCCRSALSFGFQCVWSGLIGLINGGPEDRRHCYLQFRSCSAVLLYTIHNALNACLAEEISLHENSPRGSPSHPSSRGSSAEATGLILRSRISRIYPLENSVRMCCNDSRCVVCFPNAELSPTRSVGKGLCAGIALVRLGCAIRRRHRNPPLPVAAHPTRC